MNSLSIGLWCLCIASIFSMAPALLLGGTRRLSTVTPYRMARDPLRGMTGVHGSLLHEMGISSHHSHAVSTPSHALPLGPNFVKEAGKIIIASPFILKLSAMTPPLLKTVLKCIYPGELLLLLVFQLTYSRALKFAHRMQTWLWKVTNIGTPNEWNSSILGFVHERSRLLSKLITFNYGAKLLCTMLARLGFNVRADFPSLLSRISYALFLAQFADQFKAQFLRIFYPKVSESKRQSYMVNKSASVIIWTLGALVACEMVSSYLKVPLSSTLAFGGVGGLAVGLSLRDIAANFMGGMMLLFNEPFTPGDMVTFKSGKTEIIGRVERVGWGQTRIRGRDTRPTYVPNSHFAQAAVTNMERITHRKYETIVPIRFEDYSVMTDVIERIKERLRVVPKLDVLSMPFRVSFVKVGTYSLEVEITCYFATKSIDEFLSLQQMANMEVIGAIQDCGAALALPTSLMQVDSMQGGGGRVAERRQHRVSATANPSAVHYGTSTSYSTSAVVDEEEEVADAAGQDRAITSVSSDSDLAAEMELSEALQDLPLQTSDDHEHDDLLPMGRGGGQGSADADTGSSVFGATHRKTTPTSETVRPLEPVDKQKAASEVNLDFSFGVRTFGTSVAAPSNSISVADVILPAPVSASAPVAVVAASSDEAKSGTAESDIWHESIRSAGIRTDGKKYFIEATDVMETQIAPAEPFRTTVSASAVVAGEPGQQTAAVATTSEEPNHPAEEKLTPQSPASVGTFWDDNQHRSAASDSSAGPQLEGTTGAGTFTGSEHNEYQ